MLVTNIFSISHNVSQNKFKFSVTFMLSSTDALNLDRSNMLSFGKEITVSFFSPANIAQSIVYWTLGQGVAGLFLSPANYFPRTVNCHCDRIHSSLTIDHCFNNGLVGKQQVVWTKYCTCNRNSGGNMDMCSGYHNITEIMFKMVH